MLPDPRRRRPPHLGWRWPLALTASVAALLIPIPASAQEEVAAQSHFASYIGMLALTGAVVLVAFLVNRFAPRKRKYIRRTVILLLLNFASLGLSLGLAFAGSAEWAQNFRVVSQLLWVFGIVNIAGLVVFTLGLPKLGVELATIIVDLAVGAAYIIATLAVLRQSGVNLSGILTTSAVVTGILALSLQATLGNILGGIALQLDNSIRAGDWVQLENGKQGRVREIRWRHTVIETRDWDTLIVPNAALLAATIMILGKREGEPTPHRMTVNFNVDFRYPPADVIETVERALRGAPIEGMAADPPPVCQCLDFAKDGRDSFAYYAIRYFLTDLPRDDRASSLVRARLYSALKRANIPLAVPAAQLFVEQDDPERRARKEKREADRRLEATTSVEFLKTLQPDEIAMIAKNLRFAPFAQGETITRQGAVAHWLYILTEGVAEVRVAVDGKDKVVATIKAPGIFGEMGLMTGESRQATVVAATEIESYRLDKEAFDKIMLARPAIATEISTLLAQRRVELQAAREHLDAEAKERCFDAEKKKILSTVQTFFGLSADGERRRGPP
jgi:small-conductance mechanosensitive channel